MLTSSGAQPAAAAARERTVVARAVLAPATAAAAWHKPPSTQPHARRSSGGKSGTAPPWALLARIHDAAAHAAALAQLAEASIAPAVASMRLLGAQVELQRRQLTEEETRLQVGRSGAGSCAHAGV